MQRHWMVEVLRPTIVHRIVVVAVWIILTAIVIYDFRRYTAHSEASALFGPFYFIAGADDSSRIFAMALTVFLLIPSVIYFLWPCCIVMLMNMIASLIWIILEIMGGGIRA